MKTLATYSIKGGVGKTAAAVNVSWIASQRGRQVLLWDLDPQGAASWYLRVRPEVEGGAKKLVRGKSDPADLIRGSDFERLDLLPADFSYRNLDLVLDASRKPRKRLGKTVKPLSGHYDLLVLDCAPSISLVSESVFRTADVLLVPAIPTPLSLRTVEQLAEHLDDEGRLGKLDVAVFFCIADRRKKLHREICEGWTPPAGIRKLRTVIPSSTWIEKMGTERAPVGVFAPRSSAARAFRELWLELDPILSES